MKNKLKKYLIAGLVLVLGAFIGATLFSSESQNGDHDHSQEQADDTVWTCSMHPQIRKEEPGNCPICGMELIPASQMEESVDPDAIKMSKTARELAQVETIRVGNQDYNSNLMLSGQLKVNQDKTQSLTANFKARIERLYINEEGERVTRGQVIAELYAPEIQVLKEELALATQQNNEMLLKSINRKIENYELSVSDIQSLEEGRLKLRSPITGVISSLKIKQGDNVKADQNLMNIADLSTLWAIVDVYESDLNQINVGDELKIQTPNYQDIIGKVTFITPVLDDKTRSAKARVVIQNPNRYLKPGVFITAEMASSKTKTTKNQTLMVPKSAVLWTGKRSVVYQQFENENGIYYKMKMVKTGTSSSDYIEILSGVDAGDEIVTYGAFSIDPEAQLGGKPSMMNPEGGPSSSGHDHGSMEMNTASSISKSSGVEMSSETISKKPDEVRQLVMRYSELKNALVSDDFETSKTKYEKVNLSLSHLDSQTFKTSSSINNIDELREVFIQLSEAVIAVAKVNNPTEDSLYVLRCPMANKSEGASWLSFSKEVKNPYYGASMLKCGSVIDSIQ